MLPKLNHPKYEVKIPSTGGSYKFRPYTVREQKILLMMQDSTDIDELTDCVKDLIVSCSLTEKFNPDSLSYFDIEYLFLKIRSKSVGEITQISFKCNNIVEGSICGGINRIDVSLDDVAVDFSNTLLPTIQIGSDLYIKLSYPNITSAKFLEQYNHTKEMNKLLDAISIDVIHISDSEKIYDDFTSDELKDLLLSLELSAFSNIIEFYANCPKIKKEIGFVCSKCGYEERIVLSGLSDFFE
jgi:hypothetical protein